MATETRLSNPGWESTGQLNGKVQAFNASREISTAGGGELEKLRTSYSKKTLPSRQNQHGSAYFYESDGTVSFPEALQHFRMRSKVATDPQIQLAYVCFLLDAAVKILEEPERLGIVEEISELDEERRADMSKVMETEGINLLRKLALNSPIGRQPLAEAQFMLAEKYGKGLHDIAVDHCKAFGLYVQASKQCHPTAAYRVGVSYEVGAGTKKDNSRAMIFYRKAAALGDALAMHKLALVLLYGKMDQRKSLKEGITWLKRASNAADAAHPEALHDLAQCYEKRGGCPVVIPDESYAFELYARAAQFGFAPSQFRLGSCYEYGLLGCTNDAAASIKWYSRAAEQGFPDAELALSSWYLSGASNVLQQSDQDAYCWARKAAERGHAKALYQVGNYHEIGIGVDIDTNEAVRWYMLAATKGNKRAARRLNELKRGEKKGRRCIIV